jgi:type I restriction enzyme, S subunit
MHNVIRLGDALHVKHGYAFPGENFSDDSTYPVLVTPGNFALSGGFRQAKTKTFNGDIPSEYVLKSGALIVTMTDLSKDGATLGLPAIVPSDAVYLHNQRIGLVEITDADRVDPHFLAYYLRSAPYRAEILGTASGSTVRHTSPSRIEAHLAYIPNVAHQQAIAAVLTALDDKIATNDHAVRLIEQLMVALAGTTTTRTGVADLAMQSAVVRPPESFDNVVAHYSLPAFDAGAAPEIGRGSEIKSSKLAIAEPVVLMSKLNPRIPRIWNVSALPGSMAVASTEFVALRPIGITASQLWAAMSQTGVSTEITSKVAGTSGSHQRVKPAEILELSVPDPRSLPCNVSAKINALGELVHSRRLERLPLVATRDELLPLLMSGKVCVRDAERRVEDSP